MPFADTSASTRRTLFSAALSITALAAVITSFAGGYFVYLLNLIGIFGLVAIGLNLLIGFSGQSSLGHAGFFAIGAYASGLLTKLLGLPFWVAIPIAGALATVPRRADRVAGIALEEPLPGDRDARLRHRRPEADLRMAIADRRRWRPAGAAADLSALSVAEADRMTWVIADHAGRRHVGGLQAGRRPHRPRAGDAARKRGRGRLYRHPRRPLQGRCVRDLSAFYTAVAGGLYANLVRYINPESFDVNMSIMFLAMIVIGGIGSVRGALLGAAFYVAVPEAVRGFKDAPGLIFGLSLMLVVILLPGRTDQPVRASAKAAT